MIRVGKYVVTADANCYTLSEERVAENDIKSRKVEKGETYLAPLNRFYPTVSGALSAVIRLEQREVVSNCDMTLREALQAFQEIERRVLQTHEVDE